MHNSRNTFHVMGCGNGVPQNCSVHTPGSRSCSPIHFLHACLDMSSVFSRSFQEHVPLCHPLTVPFTSPSLQISLGLFFSVFPTPPPPSPLSLPLPVFLSHCSLLVWYRQLTNSRGSDFLLLKGSKTLPSTAHSLLRRPQVITVDIH